MEDANTEGERGALIRIDPPGTYIRHPPPPDELDGFITTDNKLFQTIHMGPAVVDVEKWRLVIDGLVQTPFSISHTELTSMDTVDVTSFHECYGPPTATPIKNYWRIGNVTWTGVRLSSLLSKAGVLPEAKYVWSEGLDHGTFAGHISETYQKDLTLEKAMSDECLVAWKMNGEVLSKERGAPVRLVVPGWFGTNSTKWLCRLEVRDRRAERSIFTTKFYNEIDPGDEGGEKMRPVWEVEVNSMIIRPKPMEILQGDKVEVQGWCWSCDGVREVEIGLLQEGKAEIWETAKLEHREGGKWSWQKFIWSGKLAPGQYQAFAKATCNTGQVQALQGRRNHMHKVEFSIC